MATVTGYTAARMKEIEDGTVVNGEIVAGHLILTKFDGTEIDAGVVVGPTGDTGEIGPPGPGATTLDELTDVDAVTGLANGKGLVYDSASGLWKPASLVKTTRVAWTYTLPGEIKVPSGSTDVLPSVPIAKPSGQIVTLVGYRWHLSYGTSFTFKLDAYDATTITSLVTGVVASSSGASRGSGTFSSPYTVANDNSIWYPTITAVSGTPIVGVISLIADVTL